MPRSRTTIKQGQVLNPRGKPRTSLANRARVITRLAVAGDMEARKVLIEALKVTASYADIK